MSNKLNNKIKKLSLKGGLIIGATALSATLLTGCFGHELAAKENYDIVDSNVSNSGNELLSYGLTQELNVPGETWKIIAEFSCDSSTKREWRITSDKFLYLTINTDGLPSDYEVYIDNIHIDTSIKSTYAAMDGIKQDTMDDRIHNAQLIGFPISDTTLYYGVNAIEGANETFVHGTAYGCAGYYGGKMIEKRRTENDYVNKYGVYGNKIQAVIDLLIKGPNDQEFRNASVATDFVVMVSSKGENYTKKLD